jgi:hypothetical protein
MRWLKKIPKSAQQVLAIINEANDAYAEWKKYDKEQKNQFAAALHQKDIYVGTMINIAGNEILKGIKWKVEKIVGKVVHVRDPETKRGYKLNGWLADQYIKVV